MVFTEGVTCVELDPNAHVIYHLFMHLKLSMTATLDMKFLDEIKLIIQLHQDVTGAGPARHAVRRHDLHVNPFTVRAAPGSSANLSFVHVTMVSVLLVGLIMV